MEAACFAVLRRSLGDLLRRTGHPAAESVATGADALWPVYEGVFEHLAATAGQWWIAEDGDGRTAGYLRFNPCLML